MLRSQAQSRPIGAEFFYLTGADLEFDLEPEQIIWVGSGSFLASENRNDFNRFFLGFSIFWTKSRLNEAFLIKI